METRNKVPWLPFAMFGMMTLGNSNGNSNEAAQINNPYGDDVCIFNDGSLWWDWDTQQRWVHFHLMDI